jgi:hypothetical protein
MLCLSLTEVNGPYSLMECVRSSVSLTNQLKLIAIMHGGEDMRSVHVFELIALKFDRYCHLALNGKPPLFQLPG